jgi:hypothetical protein
MTSVKVRVITSSPSREATALVGLLISNAWHTSDTTNHGSPQTFTILTVRPSNLITEISFSFAVKLTFLLVSG